MKSLINCFHKIFGKLESDFYHKLTKQRTKENAFSLISNTELQKMHYGLKIFCSLRGTGVKCAGAGYKARHQAIAEIKMAGKRKSSRQNIG